MTARGLDVFFYGLFMDSDVLRASNVIPIQPRRAYVDDFALRIGQRATLVPSAGSRAYGMVMSLYAEDLDRLYSAPGLELYRAQAVIARPLQGEPLAALCYNLRDAPQPGERNPEYAARLKAVLTKLQFPPEYIAAIARG